MAIEQVAAAAALAPPLGERFRRVRSFSESLVEPLAAEDCVIQTMPDVSPTRWHLAHTTWFFETFVLAGDSEYRRFDPAYDYLFNSYYNSVGEQYARARRGLLSRPTLAEVLEYRRHVDDAMLRRLESADAARDAELLSVVELGLHHEQQHQELILTDILHVFSCNPLYPPYRPAAAAPADPAASAAARWFVYEEGVRWIGHSGPGFAFDNESPRHRVFLERFEIASRPVTSGEFLAFVEDGGYERPELWLSLGWTARREQGWQGPLYWVRKEGRWQEFTLHGLRPLDHVSPVCQVSYFEADAFARWAGARLPTEAEWETAAGGAGLDGNFAESEAFVPRPAANGGDGPAGLFGDVWEWTGSSYSPYPGYRAPQGALGEYNGKFMCNQYVLRGGSCVTSRTHIRGSYRNFFPPEARWQFSGLRLAR